MSGGFYYFLFKSKGLHLKAPRFKIKTIFRIIYNGLSDFAMMLVEAVMVFVINIAFIRYLTAEHFEAYASVSIVITVFYSIYMGAAMGLQPILSQMMGRKDFQTLIDVLNYSVGKTLIYGSIIYIAFIPFIDLILGLFIQDQSTLQIGRFFYLTLGFATLFSNYPLQTSMFYTAINRPLESSVISIVRTLFFIPALTFLLVKHFNSPGVAAALIITDIVLMIGIYIFMKRQDLSTIKVFE